MRWLLPSPQPQMVSNKESRFDEVYLFLKFAKQLPQAHVVCGEAANLNPLMCDLPLSDYIYDKLKPHSPNYVRHLLILESHDRLRLPSLHSKHNGCYREQRLPGEIMAPHDGMESLQIYLI
jgi:hypothetical protein